MPDEKDEYIKLLRAENAKLQADHENYIAQFEEEKKIKEEAYAKAVIGKAFFVALLLVVATMNSQLVKLSQMGWRAVLMIAIMFFSVAFLTWIISLIFDGIDKISERIERSKTSNRKAWIKILLFSLAMAAVFLFLVIAKSYIFD